jgi:hypothetical protein
LFALRRNALRFSQGRRALRQLPWHSLIYDKYLGGYRTTIPVEQLKGAPKYEAESSWNWAELARTKALDDYYGRLP